MSNGKRRPKLKSIKDSVEIFAFQRVFPHCHKILGIIPNIWFCADPYAYIEGIKYMASVDEPEFKNIRILIPDIFMKDFSHYRKYCGTTPLMRVESGWESFQKLLGLINIDHRLEVVNCTTTKFIRICSNNFDLLDDNNLFGKEAYYRFMHHQVILGTIRYDSEIVSGDRYKWGLESKLSSSVLPISYYLRAKKVGIVGFDMKGPRFYSDDSRHPWNDETQDKDALALPLSLIKQWIDWEEIHGMKIYNIAPEEKTVLSKILEYRELEEIVE